MIYIFFKNIDDRVCREKNFFSDYIYTGMEKSGGDEVFGKESDNVNWQVVYGDEGI